MPARPRLLPGRDWPRERIVTTAAAAVAIAAIAALLAHGVRGAGGAGSAADAGGIVRVSDGTACGPATDDVTREVAFVVARRLRDEERAGQTVNRARHSIASDRTLAAAVARGNAAAARREALVLLFNHEHVVTLRVLRRDGRVITRVGGRLVLTPVFATLRRHGRVVGSVEFSVQDDMGYRLLTQRLVGIDIVMRYRARTLMADIDVGSRRLPRTGAVRVGGRRYLVATIDTGHFPTGTLAISLLIPSPAPSLARESCAQVRTDLLSDITRRVYRESITGPAAVVGRLAVRSSLVLPKAIAGGQDRVARASARRLLRAGHLARLAVVSGAGRVIADVGITEPTVAPVAVPLRRHGAFVGTALLAVQSANGFVGVSSYLTGADVLVRTGGQQLAGRIGGPPALPSSGALRWRGREYHVATFAATAFPSGAVTIYTLARG